MRNRSLFIERFPLSQAYITIDEIADSCLFPFDIGTGFKERAQGEIAMNFVKESSTCSENNDKAESN